MVSLKVLRIFSILARVETSVFTTQKNVAISTKFLNLSSPIAKMEEHFQSHKYFHEIGDSCIFDCGPTLKCRKNDAQKSLTPCPMLVSLTITYSFS